MTNTLLSLSSLILYPSQSTFFRRGSQLMESIPYTSRLLLYIFKKETQFKYQIITDVFPLDFISLKRRFQLSYILSSPYNLFKLRLLILTRSLQIIPSISRTYLSSNWLERECWDMFGLFFNEQRDLRRILTDYGFKGNPLRKDFPVTGYLEISYSDQDKRIFSLPLQGLEVLRLGTHQIS